MAVLRRADIITILPQFLIDVIAAGFDDSQIPWIASILKNYVLGFVAEETRLVSWADQSDATPEQFSQEYQQMYSILPKEQFPNIIRLATYTTSTDWQQEFHFGLSVLIDGLSAKKP